MYLNLAPGWRPLDGRYVLPLLAMTRAELLGDDRTYWEHGNALLNNHNPSSTLIGAATILFALVHLAEHREADPLDLTDMIEPQVEALEDECCEECGTIGWQLLTAGLGFGAGGQRSAVRTGHETWDDAQMTASVTITRSVTWVARQRGITALDVYRGLEEAILRPAEAA